MDSGVKFTQRMEEEGRMLGRLIAESRQVSMIYATVQSVNENAFTIDAVTDTDKVFSDIPLEVVPDGGNSVIFYPLVGSFIIIGFVEDLPEQAFIVKTTKVNKILISNNREKDNQIIIESDKIEILKGETSIAITKNDISLTSDKIVLNGGNNYGIPLSQSVANKLSDIENAVNSIYTFINTFTPSGTPGDTGTWNLAKAAITGLPLSPTIRQDIENEDVTQ